MLTEGAFVKPAPSMLKWKTEVIEQSSGGTRPPPLNIEEAFKEISKKIS